MTRICNFLKLFFKKFPECKRDVHSFYEQLSKLKDKEFEDLYYDSTK